MSLFRRPSLISWSSAVTIRQHFRRLKRSTQASVAVEAALIVPVLTLMVVGVINYGGAMIARTELFNAVHAGLQYALFYKTDLDGMKGAALTASSSESTAGSITVTTSATCYCRSGPAEAGYCSGACGTSGGVDYQLATITASQTYSYLLKFPGFPTSITLSESASIRNTN